MKAADEITLERITEIRRKNNKCWMALLALALDVAPDQAKEILREINDNDKRISECLGRLANED